MATQNVTESYVIPQTAGDTYNGNARDQVYSINPNLIAAGDTITIIDQGGDNAIELPAGLEIISSQVVANQTIITLNNGAVIDIRGADTFTFNVGQNLAGGDTQGTEQTFGSFARNVLGVTVPAAGEGVAEGGPSTVNDDGTASPEPEPEPTPEPTPEPYVVHSYDEFQSALNDEEGRASVSKNLVIEVASDITDFPAAPLLLNFNEKNSGYDVTIKGHEGETFNLDAMGRSRILEIDGYGNYQENYSTIKISGINFYGGNSGDENGGAVSIGSIAHKILIEDSLFKDNVASMGGAISNSSDIIDVVDSDFIDNEALSSGGAIYNLSGGFKIYGGKFEGNKSNGTGGAIENLGFGFQVDNVLFLNNSSVSEAGAIYSRSKVLIENSEFIGNSHFNIFARNTFVKNTVFDNESPIRYDGGEIIDGLGNTVEGVYSNIGTSINLDSLPDLVFDSSPENFAFVDSAEIESDVTISSYGAGDKLIVTDLSPNDGISLNTSNGGEDLLLSIISNENEIVSKITFTGLGGLGFSNIDDFNDSSLGSIILGEESWLL